VSLEHVGTEAKMSAHFGSMAEHGRDILPLDVCL